MRKGRRVLGREEARLWAEVARSVRPLDGRAMPDFPAETAAAPIPPTPPAAVKPTGAASIAPAVPAPRLSPPSPPRLPGLHPIERPVRRKLAKGRVPIDDRIDLHDKTEAVAHYALLGFLRHARTMGFRHVLVITGRGASPGSVGALKRALPHWFDTSEFRSLVAGFEPAARSHGGAGAFYVRLRRP